MKTVKFQLVEPRLAQLDVGLDLAELLQLLVGIGVQLGGDVLHPHLGSITYINFYDLKVLQICKVFELYGRKWPLFVIKSAV